MGKCVTIAAGWVSARIELNDSPCAEAVLAALPLRSSANTWGDEIYFDVGVISPLSPDAREAMEVGEVGYWPPGQAMCIFFGRTPASGADGKPRAASKVNPIGRVVGEAGGFRAVCDGDAVRLSVAP